MEKAILEWEVESKGRRLPLNVLLCNFQYRKLYYDGLELNVWPGSVRGNGMNHEQMDE